MDINNNQQINTFTKGMDTDTSDMYIGEGSYRYAENLRVVTDKDSNSGELHLIEGTTKVQDHGAINEDRTEQILGFTSIRQYIIEIVRRDNSWAIVRYDTKEDPDTRERKIVAGWFLDRPIWPTEWDGKTKPLSLVTRWESSENIKLYIATGTEELLSLNISELNLGSDFNKVFQVTKIMLQPISATVTENTSASIPGVVLQYAYIIYKVHGQSSTMSTLSNVVKQPDDYTHGYTSETRGSKIVELTLPSDIIGNRVRIYRVAYSKAGQLPTVDIIYDLECQHLIIYDQGQSLLNVSTAEFIATNKLLFLPKEIETKGNYLFAANVEYRQDAIDDTFENFDARCYSSGNYYIQDGIPHNINISDESSYLNVPKDADLHHRQFDSASNTDYNSSYWNKVDGANGRGACFEWKYEFHEYILEYSNQYGVKEGFQSAPRTYARNEVYRFGVRLFDEKGNASSVKWIADIKMPDYIARTGGNHDEDYILNNGASYDSSGDVEEDRSITTISIKFKPINTDKDYWKNVYRYEIVLAKRSIEDSYKVTQGIFGFPMSVSDNELCLPYFLTTSPLVVKRGFVTSANKAIGDYSYIYREIEGYKKSKKYEQFRNALIYASPEYTYLPDDVKAILNKYKDNLEYKPIGWWDRYAEVVIPEDSVPFNQQESDGDSISTTERHVLKYRSENLCKELNIPKNNVLCPDETDLRVQLYHPGETVLPSYIGQYCISTQTMNVDSANVASFDPLTVAGKDEADKRAYFTNMYPQSLSRIRDIARTPMHINGITYVDVQSQDNFAKDETPTYKNQFSTLHNGKKFYNWTNPVMFDNDVYQTFIYGGDTTKESFRETTMTSYHDSNIDIKNRLETDNIGGTNLDLHALVGSYALAFPFSSGGPNMILEFDQDLANLVERSYLYDTQARVATMPPISVGNIYKPATPYGGYYKSTIDNTQYVSCGKINSKSAETDMDFGDNYITMFVYCLYHCFDNAQHNSVKTACTLYIVPIESTIDLTNQCSKYIQATNHDDLPLTGTDEQRKGIWVQAKPTSLSGRFTLTTDMYMYNTAYSILPDVVTYAGQDTVNKADSLYDSRIHYSQKKDNNELIDSWTSFKAIDYLDVDSRYGQITGLKLFRDKLIFLQENGAGVLSVNDRIILKDQDSANIIVGNGGVLDRYDYFTTIYGMKPNLHVVETTNDALYWWDGHRREILGYTDGYSIALLQRIKNVQNYINNGEESTTPSIICDANNKEVLFNVVNNKSLVYNEQIQQFTSVYTFNPIYYCNVDGTVYLTDDWHDKPNLYIYGQGEDNVTLFEDTDKAFPLLRYVVNKDPVYNKVFDIQTFGGRFYKGDKSELEFDYKTPLKQHSHTNGNSVTDIEYDYRLAIPRNNNDAWGGRMRGKTMECEITSSSNDKDFSIQYVTTKYRMSWT